MIREGPIPGQSVVFPVRVDPETDGTAWGYPWTISKLKALRVIGQVDEAVHQTAVGCDASCLNQAATTIAKRLMWLLEPMVRLRSANYGAGALRCDRACSAQNNRIEVDQNIAGSQINRPAVPAQAPRVRRGNEAERQENDVASLTLSRAYDERGCRSPTPDHSEARVFTALPTIRKVPVRDKFSESENAEPLVEPTGTLEAVDTKVAVGQSPPQSDAGNDQDEKRCTRKKITTRVRERPERPPHVQPEHHQRTEPRASHDGERDDIQSMRGWIEERRFASHCSGGLLPVSWTPT